MKIDWVEVAIYAAIMVVSRFFSLTVASYFQLGTLDLIIGLVLPFVGVGFAVSAKHRMKPGLVALGLYFFITSLVSDQMYRMQMPKNFYTSLQFFGHEKTIELINDPKFNPSEAPEGYSRRPIEHLACGPYNPPPLKIVDALLSRRDLIIKTEFHSGNGYQESALGCFLERRAFDVALRVIQHPGYSVTTLDISALFVYGDLQLYQEALKIRPEFGGELINHFAKGGGKLHGYPFINLVQKNDPEYLNFVIQHTKADLSLPNPQTAFVQACRKNAEGLLPILLSAKNVKVNLDAFKACTLDGAPEALLERMKLMMESQK